MKDEIPWEGGCRDYDIEFNGAVAATSEGLHYSFYKSHKDQSHLGLD